MTLKEHKIREAVANLLRDAGCGCCQDGEFQKSKEALATLLAVPMYEDKTGYDFSLFCTPEENL